MAARAVDGPYTAEFRFVALAGDDDDRTRLYMFRRHLGLSAAGVDALPWWEHGLLWEGLVREFSEEDEGVGTGGLDELGVTVRGG